MDIRWDRIVANSYVDGPGQRAVLFMQGCDLRCPGCQSPHLWDASGGATTSVETVADALLGCNSEALTISGGEPFRRPEVLDSLTRTLKIKVPRVHILVYTGQTWEAILSSERLDDWPFAHLALQDINVLVDGPYIAALDDNRQQWRGSSNQRVIDVPQSIKTGTVVTLDWQTPRLIVAPDGDTYTATAYAALTPEGQTAVTRRCGQSD